MKRVLVFMALAALMAAPASAQVFTGDDFNFAPTALGGVLGAENADFLIPTSLQYENSFGLFLNSFDYAAMNPADFAKLTGDESTRYLGRPSVRGEEAFVVYTNLYNFGERDSLQLGGFDRVGPGNLGGAIGYTEANEELNDNDDGESIEFDDTGMNLFVTYGWDITDTLALGFSYRLLDKEFSFADQDLFFNDGEFKNEFMSQKLVGALRGDMSDEFSFNVLAYLTANELEVGIRDRDFSGDDFFAGGEWDGMTFGLKGRANWYWDDDNDFELFAGIAFSEYDLDNDDIYREEGVGVNELRRWNVTGDTNESDAYNIGGKWLHRRGDTDFAVGLEIWQSNYDVSYDYRQVDFDADATAGGETTVSARVKDEIEVDNFSWAVPMSIRHHFSDKFSLILGGRFAWMQAENDRKIVVNGGTNQDTSFESTQSFTDYRIGCRYEINDFVALQALFGEESQRFSFGGFSAPIVGDDIAGIIGFEGGIPGLGPVLGDASITINDDGGFDREVLSSDIFAVSASLSF
jgi:hypothetical protein